MKHLTRVTLPILYVCLGATLLSFMPSKKLKFKELWKPIGNNVYASVIETTVHNYREFLNEIRSKTDQWEQYQYDTTIWNRHHISFQKFGTTYLDHPPLMSIPS